jgi:hypothetical protein
MNSRQQEIIKLLENTLDAEAAQTDTDGMIEFIEGIGEKLADRYHRLKGQGEPAQQQQQQTTGEKENQ